MPSCNVYDTIHEVSSRGVSELRIDWGPGYRVYFGRDGRTVVVLLCGGDKRKQDTDIEKAVALWQEYGKRKKSERRAKT